MVIEKNFSLKLQRTLGGVRHSDSELKCKRLLAIHRKSGKPDNMTVVTWLYSLAQALEGQKKYAEGLTTRVRVRDMLISFMGAA